MPMNVRSDALCGLAVLAAAFALVGVSAAQGAACKPGQVPGTLAAAAAPCKPAPSAAQQRPNAQLPKPKAKEPDSFWSGAHIGGSVQMEMGVGGR